MLALLHFALRDGGYLFLGNAETVGRSPELFEPVSKKWRIYRRIGGTRHDLVEFPVAGRRDDARMSGLRALAALPPARIADTAQRALAERFAPASVLIDRSHRILYFHGPTELFLTQPSGEPTQDLYGMARPGLRTKLRVAVQRVIKSNEPLTTRASIRPGAERSAITISVAPLPGAADNGLLLVSFEEGPRRRAAIFARRPPPVRTAASRISRPSCGRCGTSCTRTIAELETSNEELKASNEEVTSMNEELQSANEELETSKEELQSLNEELNTVNNQLQRKVEELEDTTNDLRNLLTSTDIATVFLDPQFRIRWFTPAIHHAGRDSSSPTSAGRSTISPPSSTIRTF